MATLKIVPDKLDIVVCPGAALALGGVVDEDGPDCASPAIITDVTGWTGQIRFKSAATATDVVQAFPISFGGVDGSVSISVTAAELAALPDSVKGYDIMATDRDSVVIPIAYGRFTRGYE